MEFMAAVSVVKLVASQIREIIKNNKELAVKAKGLQKDILIVDLVVEEIEASKVAFSPHLQLAVENLRDNLEEVKEILEAIENKSKWYHKTFMSRKRLSMVDEASKKISDQIELLPAAFDLSSYAESIGRNVSTLHDAIKDFLADDSVRGIWHDLNEIEPNFEPFYAKFQKHFPQYLDPAASIKVPSSDARIMAKAWGTSSEDKLKIKLVKFSLWLKSSSLEAAICSSLLEPFLKECHARRKEVIYPDMEILWLGEHLAEYETRQALRQVFKEAQEEKKEINITYCITLAELKTKLESSPRLISQMLCNRVVAITSIDKWKQMHDAILDQLSKAHVITDSDDPSSSPFSPVPAGDSPVPMKEESKYDEGLEKESSSKIIGGKAVKFEKILVHHCDLKSFYRHLKVLRVPLHVTIGKDALTSTLKLHGTTTLTPKTRISEEELAKLVEEAEKIIEASKSSA